MAAARAAATTARVSSRASATRSTACRSSGGVGARQRQHLVDLARGLVELLAHGLQGLAHRAGRRLAQGEVGWVTRVVSGVRSWCEASSTKRRRASWPAGGAPCGG
jgi:hypothetical protein